MSNMERIVVNMIEAVVIAWRDEQFGIDAYDSLVSRYEANHSRETVT